MITCLPGINMKASCVFMQIYWLDRDTGQKEGIWNATFGHNYNQCLLTRYARKITQQKQNYCKAENGFFKVNKICTKSAKKVHKRCLLDKWGHSLVFDAIAYVSLVATSICYCQENLRLVTSDFCMGNQQLH